MMTPKELPVWRSMLFVPVTERRFVDGAARRGADAIILDLEDAVAASEKERARTLVPEAAQIVSRGGADVVVRINRPMRMTVRDLEAVIGPGVQAIALPKAERFRNWLIGPSLPQERRRDWPGSIFTSVFSHSTVRPEVHCWQAPQKTDRQPITWSPGAR